MTALSLGSCKAATAAIARRCSLGPSVTRRSFSALISTDDEYPGIPSLIPESKKAASPSVTTLSNGCTVITEGASSTSSTIRFTYPKAGSSNELVDEEGAAFNNKYMSFKTGTAGSTLLSNRMIEDKGGTPYFFADRYCATLGCTVVPDGVITVLPFMATDCFYEKWDLKDARTIADLEKKAAADNAQVMLTENLYAAAYGPKSAVGRPFYTTGTSVDAMASFRARTYGMKGAVLCVTGVSDHAGFCAEVETALADAPPGTDEPASAATYIGGESRVLVPSATYAHIALAFAAPTSSVVADVVKNVLTLMGSEATVQGFGTKGLVGLYAGSEEPEGIVDSMSAVFKGTPSSDVIKRAKKLSKAEALFALDGGGSQSLADYMTKSYLSTGSALGPDGVAAAYDSVSDSDVKNALATMIKTTPALASVGNIASVPYQATL